MEKSNWPKFKFSVYFCYLQGPRGSGLGHMRSNLVAMHSIPHRLWLYTQIRGGDLKSKNVDKNNFFRVYLSFARPWGVSVGPNVKHPYTNE